MLLIKRSLTSVLDKQPPLTWRPLQIRIGKYTASFVCSNGHDGTLFDYIISSDGTVSPSVVCNGIPNKESCNFHEFIKLDGWSY